MINFISSWAKQIILAVIIASIIEMILPNGTSKKYIKVVIGVYILFNIITPIINKITNSSGNSIDVSKFINLDTYVNIQDKTNKNTKSIETKNEENIKQIYITKLKSDIKNKLKDMDYEVNNIQIILEDDEEYTIKNISMKVIKDNIKEGKNETKNNIEPIKQINISILEEENNYDDYDSNKNYSLSDKDKNEIKEYLNKTYNIKFQNINIS